MTKRVAFVGFGEVLDNDSQRVADALGVDKNNQLGFFNTINDAAAFVVVKIDGKITAIDGSEVYISSDADNETISKARKISSVGVSIKLDWEPFGSATHSDSALRSWVSDGEWIEDFVDYDTLPVQQQGNDFEVVEGAVEFETPAFNESEYNNAPPEYIDDSEPSNYAAPDDYAAPDYQFEGISPLPNTDYSAPDSIFDAPVEDAPQESEQEYQAPNDYAQEDIPAFDFVEPNLESNSDYPYQENNFNNTQQFLPPVQEEEENNSYLDSAQDQTPQAAPLSGFLQVTPPSEELNYAPPVYPPVLENDASQRPTVPEYEELPPAYDNDQYPTEQQNDYAAYPPPAPQDNDTTGYSEPQYQDYEPQQEVATQQYDYNPPAPEYTAPVETPQDSRYGGYTPPTTAAPFIQESNSSAPELTTYQRERSMFEQVPAGNTNDFESRPGGKTVYVTGSHGGAGKTTTAWTLASLVAVAMKKAGNEDISVWLIESDYRNSKLAQRHNIDPGRTSGHLAEMLEWLNDQSGIVSDLPKRKAQAIANSTHRLDNGLNIIACPYDTTKRDMKYIQQAVFQAAQYAKMQGGIVFIDAATISNDDIMDSKLAKAADRVVIVSDAGDEHIDDLKRAARILTTSVISGGLGVAMPAITVLLNRTGADVFKEVEDSGILAPLALGGYLPFIPEWTTGWVGSLTNTDTFQNAVVLFARFFNGIVPLKELHQWSNYRANPTSKKSGGWISRIFSSRKAKI